ncbi:MAG: Tfp pilus assembly protein FimT/FimU [Candidatus Roizmanbacteria bacterium]
MKNEKFFFVSKKAAFTLIELLVVFTIGAFLFGAGIASYGAFNKDKRLESHARGIYELIESAKVKARSNDTGGCTSLSNYKITVSGPRAVTIEAVCVTGTSSPYTYDIDSSDAVEIDTSVSSSTLSFYHLRSTNDQGCIVLQDLKSLSCRNISLSSSGVLTLQKNCSCS